MPLFEVGPDGLVPLQRLDQAVGDFDRQIEDALWRDPDPVYGSRLLRIQQRPTLSASGHPTLIAVDREGRLVVVHARQRIDRNELAECLEYFGWARATSLEELASLYWRGEDVFWTDWKRFADEEGVTKLAGNPKLVLVAGELADRTTATFQLLVENGLPLTVSTLGVWRSSVGTLLLDISDQGHAFGRASGIPRIDSDAEPADAVATRPYSSVPYPSGSSGSVAVDGPSAGRPSTVEPVTASGASASRDRSSPLDGPSPLNGRGSSAGPGAAAAERGSLSPAPKPAPAAAPPATPPGPRPPASMPVLASPVEPPPGPPAPAADEAGRPSLSPVARGGRATRRTGAEPVSPARAPGLSVVGGDGPRRADEPGRVEMHSEDPSRGDAPGRADGSGGGPGRSAGPVSPAAGLSVVPNGGPRPEPGRPEEPPVGLPESGRPERPHPEQVRPDGPLRSEEIGPAADRPEVGRRPTAGASPVRRIGPPASHAAADEGSADRSAEFRPVDPLNDPISTLTGGLDEDPFPPSSGGRHGRPPASEPPNEAGVRLGQPRRPMPSGSERDRGGRPGADRQRRGPHPVSGPVPPGPGGPSNAGPVRPEPDAPAAHLSGPVRDPEAGRGERSVIGGPSPTTVLGVPPEFGPPSGSREPGPRESGPREPGLRDVGGRDGREPGLREPLGREPAPHEGGHWEPGLREVGGRPGQPPEGRPGWGRDPREQGDQPPAPDPRFGREPVGREPVGREPLGREPLGREPGGRDRDVSSFERPTGELHGLGGPVSAPPVSPRSGPPAPRQPYDDAEDTSEIPVTRPRPGRPGSSGRVSATGTHPVPSFPPGDSPYTMPSDRPFGMAGGPAGGPGGAAGPGPDGPGPHGSGPHGPGRNGFGPGGPGFNGPGPNGPGPNGGPPPRPGDLGGPREAADGPFRRPDGLGGSEWEVPPPPQSDWNRGDRRRDFDDRRPNGPGDAGPFQGGPAPAGSPFGGPPTGGSGPDGPVFGGPPSGRPVSGGEMFGRPPTGGPGPDGPAFGGPPSARPVSDGPIFGDPPAGGPVSGGPVFGGPPAGGPVSGAPVFGGPPVGGPGSDGPVFGGPPPGGSAGGPGPYGETYGRPSGPPSGGGWPGTPEWPAGPGGDGRDYRDPRDRDPRDPRDRDPRDRDPRDRDPRDPRDRDPRDRDPRDDWDADDQPTALRSGPTLVWDARTHGEMMQENGNSGR